MSGKRQKVRKGFPIPLLTGIIGATQKYRASRKAARSEQRRDPMSELSNIKNQALTERVEERLYRYILNERLT